MELADDLSGEELVLSEQKTFTEADIAPVIDSGM